MAGGMEFEVRFPKRGSGGGGGAGGRPDRFRILVLSDLRGHRKPEAGISPKRVRRVDVDEFDAVMAAIRPSLSLTLPGADGGIDLSFASLEDFEPDRIVAQLEVFRNLDELKRRLLDGATFEAAARELGVTPSAPEGAAPAAAVPETDDATLDRLLLRPAGAAADARAAAGIGGFLQSIVGPYVVRGPDARQSQLAEVVDRVKRQLLRAILLQADFKVLEAAWRSLWLLVSGAETNEELSIHVLDVSRAEIDADLAAAKGEFERWALHRTIVESTGPKRPGGEPWSLLVGDYTFGPETADVAFLGAMGVLASQAGGPFVAGANPQLLGVARLSGDEDPSRWRPPGGATGQRWAALRSSPFAGRIGLAAPRLLLRHPYREGGEATEIEDFDELGLELDHEAFAWGNAAYGVALLAARSFTDGAPVRELPDRPVFTTTDRSGETVAISPAEAWLSDRAVDRLSREGIIPVVAEKNGSTVRIPRFPSIADPPAALPLP